MIRGVTARNDTRVRVSYGRHRRNRSRITTNCEAPEQVLKLLTFIWLCSSVG
jgi:hypothetical protein